MFSQTPVRVHNSLYDLHSPSASLLEFVNYSDHIGCHFIIMLHEEVLPNSISAIVARQEQRTKTLQKRAFDRSFQCSNCIKTYEWWCLKIKQYRESLFAS